jgi:uncharacterized protein
MNLELIYEPWPWYVAGPLIALTMLSLYLFGERFGISSNLRTICSISGAGRYSEFFRFNWKDQIWNLIFVVGAILGGFIAHQYLTTDFSIALNPKTVQSLKELGLANPGNSYVPEELFGNQSTGNLYNLLYLLVGGLLIGFGTRYAGGCTSGHAISGLSNLQIPSLIAVVGFFIGGLIMTHLVLPIIF